MACVIEKILPLSALKDETLDKSWKSAEKAPYLHFGAIQNALMPFSKLVEVEFKLLASINEPLSFGIELGFMSARPT